MTEELFRPNCIRTQSGNFINFVDPNPDSFIIEDIAHGLANERRWANQIPEPNQGYTVAQHSLLASELADEPHKLAALMHDSFEPYGRDMSSPMKALLQEYKVIEDRFMRVIAAKFGFEYPLHPHVKKIDNFLLLAEGQQLMVKSKIIFPNMPIYDFYTAKANFLKRFYELTGSGNPISSVINSGIPQGPPSKPIADDNNTEVKPQPANENGTAKTTDIEPKHPPIQTPESLPAGFRYIEEGETLPSGPYEIHMDLASNRNITNAPKKSDSNSWTALTIVEGKKNGTEFLYDKANENYIRQEWENGELKNSRFITQPEYERGLANHVQDTIIPND